VVRDKILIIKKTCIDCGKQFTAKLDEDDDDAIVICEDCLTLLKRKFWSSIKIGMRKNNNITKDDRENKQNNY
jgi:hypothetical protein